MANIALRAARSAADFIAQNFDRPDERNIQSKARNDFVSDIDKRAESIIIAAIEAAYPDHAIIAEESGTQDRKSEFTWVIDPLDGTLNFLQGIPHFAVSIAVQKGRHLEHGVIVDPIRNEEFVASRGHGAQLNGKRIRVAGATKLADAVVGTGLPPGSVDQRLDDYMTALTQITREARGIRRCGSAALDLAYVAAGRTEAFFEPGLAQWDIAAGMVLVREAGGFLADLQGGERYWDSGDILATNPKLMRQLVQYTRNI